MEQTPTKAYIYQHILKLLHAIVYNIDAYKSYISTLTRVEGHNDSRRKRKSNYDYDHIILLLYRDEALFESFARSQPCEYCRLFGSKTFSNFQSFL